VLSRRIAREISLPDVEEVMVAGLLHDLGKVVLAQVAAEDYEVALQLADSAGSYIGAAEVDVFGVDHACIGGWLSQHWCFPPRLAEPLQFHHAPLNAAHSRDVTAVVHLADILARGMGYGSPGDMAMPPLDQAAFQSLHISFAQLDKIIADADAEFSAGAALFDMGD
jgi:HD-like signal output (HDOD) protein